MLIDCTQLIEITVPANSTAPSVKFPNEPFLNGQYVRSMETYTLGDISLSPSGLPLITGAMMMKCFLNLFVYNPKDTSNKGYYINLLPLVSLHLLQNVSNDPFERTPFYLSDKIISWDKTTVSFGGALGNTVDTAILVNVGFRFNPEYAGN